MNLQKDNTFSQEERLPFDPRTFLLGLWGRKRYLSIGAMCSLALSVIIGLSLGTRIYKAETILLYKPSENSNAESGNAQSFATQKNLVKIISNLEEIRKRNKISASLDTLGAAIEVFTQKGTDLMVIRATWDSAEKAAAIANGARDVFLENQRKILKSEVFSKITSLESRLQSVREKLKKADEALKDFTTKNKVVDLDKEAQWYLEELTSINLLLSEAESEQNSIDSQKNKFAGILKDLVSREKQEKASQAQLDNLGDVNIRFRRLRDAISDDRDYRANLAELSQKELEYERSKRLKKDGFISEREFEKAKAEYEKQKALTQDTDQVAEWKKEIAKLDKVVIPSSSSPTASGKLLQEFMLKEFEIQLKDVSLIEKVKHLKETKKNVEERLNTLPALQREHVALTRDVSSFSEERLSLEKLLADTNRIYESDATDFTVISPADVPVLPMKSNRKILFVAVFAFGMSIAFLMMVLLEALDTTIKSGAEVSLKLSLPLIASIPQVSTVGIFPTEQNSEPQEVFRIMARQIRNQFPGKGIRILIASAQHGEGKTSIAANLALSLGRMDERVLLIDAQIRPGEGAKSISELIPNSEDPQKGIGEYLSFETEEYKEFIYPTFLPGVECLPKIKEAVIPDLIASKRMESLLADVSKKYGIILIDSSPVLPYVDAETLARWVDGILFVVGSRQASTKSLKAALDRITKFGNPVFGAVLNSVDPLFMDI